MIHDPALAAAEGILVAYLLTGKGEHSEAIRRWLDELPAEEALLLRLRYMEGLPWALVARELHMSERSVYDVRSRLLFLLSYSLGIKGA